VRGFAIWHGRFAVGDDVFDVLARAQLHPTSEELLRGNRSNTSFLIVAGLPRDALADDKFRDAYFTIRESVFIVRKHPACDLKFFKIRLVVVGLGEDGEHFVLHSSK